MSPPRRASSSTTTAARTAASCCPKRWAPAAPFSTTTPTAGRTSCWSTAWTGPATRAQRSTLRLYRNNRNGTFTDVTRSAGLDVEMYGMGVAVGDYNNDGFPTSWSPASARIGCSGTPARARSSTSPERSGLAGRAALQHLRALVRFRSRRPARPVRLQLRQVVAGARRVLQPRRQTEIVLHARSLPRRNLLAVSQSRQRDLRGRHRDERHLRHQFEVAGRGDARLRPGRLARSARRQRHAAQQALSQPAQRHFQGGRAWTPGSRSARTARPAPAWAWTSATSTTPGSPGIAITNFDNEMIGLYRAAGHGSLSRMSPREPAVGQPSRDTLGFGCVFFDARSGRQARSGGRERPHRRNRAQHPRQHRLRAAAAPVPESAATGTFRDVAAEAGAGFRAAARSAAASLTAISTGTATSIC